MKRIYIIIVMLWGATSLSAQDLQKLDKFQKEVLSQYADYFNKAELVENNRLRLNATNFYSLLSVDEKSKVVYKIGLVWQDTLIFVHYGTKKEIWNWDFKNKSVRILDVCDFSKQTALATPVITLQKTALHPWFTYIGLLFTGDNQRNVDFSLNARLGCFLLKNRWDLAGSLSTGYTENLDKEGSSKGFTILGIMSRVYFPIKNTGIFPNIGGDLNFDNNGPTAGLLLGLRIHMDKGSFDLGFRIGREATMMGGYTYFPPLKMKKK